MRYDKQRKKSESNNTNQDRSWVLGMLHIVKIKYQRRTTGEMVKQRILIVGAEATDIEKKLRWIYSPIECSGFVVESVEKVREKLHVLSTTISEPTEKPDAVIDRGTRSEIVIQSNVPAQSDVTNPDAADITAGWHKYAI